MLDHIQERIDNDCFQSLQDLKLVIRNVFNVQVCTSTIFNAIEGFKYSLKRVQCIAVAADTPANEVLRLEFANWFIEMRLEGRTMIKVDETGFEISMRSTYGRSPVNERAQARVRRLRTRNINVMAAMHDTGMTHYEILDGNGNAERFTHFIDDLAAARDRHQLPANAIVVLDNVRFHRSAIVVEMLQLRGFEYKYLPPYSPFFMGIECLFSEWKHYVKVGLQGERVQDEDALMDRIRAFELAPAHAHNYFQHVSNNCLAFIRGQRVFDN